MGLDKILLSQKKTIRFQDMGSSHRFPNAWEYFFPVLQKKRKGKLEIPISFLLMYIERFFLCLAFKLRYFPSLFGNWCFHKFTFQKSSQTND